MIREILEERKLPALKSREEMLELLQRYEYGFIPPKPESVEWIVEENMLPHGRIQYFCAGYADAYKITAKCVVNGKTFSFPFYGAIPAKPGTVPGKYPFFIHINFRENSPDIGLPTEELIDNGFAVFHFDYRTVTSDDRDFTNGLAGVLYADGKRAPTDAGKIAMWAWAAQRVLDFAYTMSDRLDLSRACVCSHSWLGKTALLAAATDTRFSFCHSNDSGCSGAAITRDKIGERIEDICRVYPFWFCENYLNYRQDVHTLPLDQHYLIAAVAPRYVSVASAANDSWADPASEFLGCAAASPAYEALGLTGLACEDRIPENDECLPDGRIGYHVRPGEHYIGRKDWHRLIQFIKKHSENTEQE